MELMHANKQWSTRPDDERYPTLQALHDAAIYYRNQSIERDKVALGSIRAQANGGEVELVGKGGVGAKLTHWAFGQVAKYAGAPADYLRGLPATLAVQNVNHGLAQRAKDTVVNLLFHSNSGYMLKAFTSERYERIWNAEVTERLLDMGSKGWVPATPTFNQDLDPNHKSTALYVSDHDLFAFITHPDRVIKEKGNERGLLKGLIAINSEVGAAKLRLLRFFYREMCGNHIIWGAEDVTEVALRHVGNIRGNFGLWSAKIQQYLDSSVNEDEAKIARAQSKLIGGSKNDVLDALFGKRGLNNLSLKAIDAGYEAVIPDQDGDPRSVWGMAQGLTRYSQTIPYADQRTAIDTAAGKIIDLF